MFKVSLLPAAYRQRLDGKKKKDLISKVALVILICLFIIYGGIAVKGQILNSKLTKLNQKNSEIQGQFPALQKYQQIYNDLQSAQKMIASISPKDPEAVEFFTTISNVTPDYVQVSSIDLESWFSEGVCTLTCKVQDFSDVKDYQAIFETEDMKKIIKSVQVTSIQLSTDTDGNRSVEFTLVLSMTGNVKAAVQAPQIVAGAATTAASGTVTTTAASGTATTAASGTATTAASGTATTAASGTATTAASGTATTAKGAK